MNNIFKLFLSLLLIVSFGCEQFVDEPKPEAEVGSESVFSSADGVSAFLTGTYRQIRGFNDDMNGVTEFSNDDSEGYGSILNTRTVKGNDMVQPAFQWMVFEYRYLDRQNVGGRKVEHIWDLTYEIINSMNLLIASLETSPISDADKLQFEAEARAIRGFMYFEAIKEYALPYLAGTENVGIPIYLEPTGVETTGNPRSSTGDVYDVIVDDLTFASDNLDYERDFNWTINKTVADGLLARVYLHMGRYADAASAANDARTAFIDNESDLDASAYTDGFDDMDSPEWMWALPFSADQTLFFGSFASFWDGERYTPTIRANPNFTAEFTETDVRNLFAPDTVFNPELGIEFVSKFQTNDDFGEDVVLMRVAEMYLIEAEALARAGGNDTEAANLLYTLQSNRDPDLTTPSGNTGNALIDEIMLERRKELYGEGLADFPDNRRLQNAWARDDGHPAGTRKSFEINDYELFYPIPQEEIDANPMINQEDQNPLSDEDDWPPVREIE